MEKTYENLEEIFLPRNRSESSLSTEITFENLNALKEAYTDEWAVAAFRDGSLQKWAEDMYYEELSNELASIPKKIKTDELTHRLRIAFGFETAGKVTENEEKLGKYTDDEKLLKKADVTAFTQKELGGLLRNGARDIQLCGGEFSIPLSIKDVSYTLIGGAKINAVPDKTELLKRRIRIIEAGKEEALTLVEQALSDFSVQKPELRIVLEKSMKDYTDYDSRYECEQAYNDRFGNLYNEAASYLSPSGSRSIATKAAAYYSEKMSEALKKHEVALFDLMLNEDYEELAKLCECYRPIKEALCAEFGDGYYELTSRELFSPDIEERVKDVRPGKILSGVLFDVKAWYYRNGHSVKQELQQEAQEKADSLCNYAEGFFRENVLKPITEILSKYDKHEDKSPEPPEAPDNEMTA